MCVQNPLYNVINALPWFLGNAVHHSLIHFFDYLQRLTYRVSHIKLDRVNRSKLRFGDKSENLGRMNHFEKFN